MRTASVRSLRGIVKRGQRLSFNEEIATAIVSPPIIGADVESEDGIDLNWLAADHDRGELPARQGSHHFHGHVSGASFEHTKILKIAGSIEHAADHQARAR